MKGTNKKNQLASVKNIMEESMTSSFDTLFNQDEEKVNKEIEYHNKKQGKKVQLLAKVNQIQMRLSKAQTSYRKSLVDPTVDSVEIAIEIKTLAEEQKIAESVLHQLFPETKIG